MINQVESVILPAGAIFTKTARLLEHVLNRAPTYSDLAYYLAHRFTEVCFIPVFAADRPIAPDVLSLDILDHVVFETYHFNNYAFNLHGCGSSLELFVNEHGLYFTPAGAIHVYRENNHTPVPRARYHHQTLAFTPPRLAHY